MAKYYYKGKKKNVKRMLRALSICIFVLGFGILIYVFLPLVSWQIYFAPVFASQNIEVPIPKTTVVNGSSISTLITDAAASIGTNYNDASNWYPNVQPQKGKIIPFYSISIPKLKINNAVVSTVDTDLTKHLVQYNTDSIPPLNGNTVIFGHSTLPQLFDPGNYKTIFANAYQLEVGDDIFVNVNDVSYRYTIQSITVVDPTDTGVLAQDFSGSYLTVITCTPPGTVWKRLIIRAKLNSLNG